MATHQYFFGLVAVLGAIACTSAADDGDDDDNGDSNGRGSSSSTNGNTNIGASAGPTTVPRPKLLLSEDSAATRPVRRVFDAR